MKKIILILSIFILIFTTIAFAEPDLDLLANSAILYETNTNQVIYQKNSDTKQYPANLTKILTAIIALEECQLTDSVIVSQKAITSVADSSSLAKLKSSEVFTVEQLLYALLLPSGNDAANVLAEHIAGSNESFATMMNTKAKEIGAVNSNFVNPHGLHDANQYTTANDLLLITAYAMKNETFKNIVNTKTYTMPNTNIYTEEKRVYQNTNLLLFENPVPPNTKSYYYQYATGIKTGETSESGKILIASAKKDNMELICIILGIKNNNENTNRYLDAKKLFTYGFNNFTLQQLNIELPKTKIDKSKGKKELELEVENLGYILATSGTDISTANPKVTLKQGLVAPIQKGDLVGTVEYEIDDKVYSYNLIAKDTIEERTSIFKVIWNVIKFIFKIIIYIIISLIVFAILVRIIKKVLRKKKKNRARRYR